MKKERVYEVGNLIKGRARDIYNVIMVGVDNPPSLAAFINRLDRGESTLEELRRPAGTTALSKKGYQSKNAKVYEIGKLKGTGRELYKKITEKIENPPTLAAFLSRLKKGEVNLTELARPNYSLSSAGALGKINNSKNQGKQSWRKRNQLPDPDKQNSRDTTPNLSNFDAEKFWQNTLVSKSKPYFRPGSLYAWPELEQKLLKGWP